MWDWKRLLGVLVVSGWTLLWSGCQGLSSGTATVTGNEQDLTKLNHIILMAQENRSLDEYFGALPAYWAANGFPSQPFDGLPQFNPAPGAAPSLPGCDPAAPFNASSPIIQDCVYDPSVPVPSFHMISACVEDPSPSWNESHVDWNYSFETGAAAPPWAGNGFVWTAAHDARYNQPPFYDTEGQRAMGYYDSSDLPYYYFMASNFATSDRWFSPAMSRTQVNRMYMLAATSHGHAYPLSLGSAQLTDKTIFQLLDENNITWKDYVVSPGATPVDGSAFAMFDYSNTHSANVVPISQYFTDVAAGTLPAVAIIDPGYSNGLDEHGDDNDSSPGGSVQVGSQYVSTLINALMGSVSWKDSAFILTYDEAGGFYDHVSPQPMPSPDNIPPSDLQPGDVCADATQPTCNFDYTGYRIPLIVVSPFTRKNYVSHTVADYTAVLKLIETRFNLPSLTARDAAQMDMTEFFDFAGTPWATPPTPPAQPTDAPCYLNALP
jgi:phospholipase C